MIHLNVEAERTKNYAQAASLYFGEKKFRLVNRSRTNSSAGQRDISNLPAFRCFSPSS